MSFDAVVEKVTPVFREVFENDSLILHRDMTAADVANWDSLNHITLVVELEALTGLSFTTDELTKLASVGDFIDLLVEKGFAGGE